MSETALGLRFLVTIDGLLLGDWTKCDGLSIEYDVTEYREGGENTYIHRLAGRAKYTNIKVETSFSEFNAYFQKLATDIGPMVQLSFGVVTVPPSKARFS